MFNSRIYCSRPTENIKNTSKHRLHNNSRWLPKPFHCCWYGPHDLCVHCSLPFLPEHPRSTLSLASFKQPKRQQQHQSNHHKEEKRKKTFLWKATLAQNLSPCPCHLCIHVNVSCQLSYVSCIEEAEHNHKERILTQFILWLASTNQASSSPLHKLTNIPPVQALQQQQLNIQANQAITDFLCQLWDWKRTLYCPCREHFTINNCPTCLSNFNYYFRIRYMCKKSTIVWQSINESNSSTFQVNTIALHWKIHSLIHFSSRPWNLFESCNFNILCIF